VPAVRPVSVYVVPGCAIPIWFVVDGVKPAVVLRKMS
jgi:hypothetical protein